MRASANAPGLLRAIDSKDFGNVAEYLHRYGAVELPGLRFTLMPGGRVLVEYDPTNPRCDEIKQLDRKFCHRWGSLLRRAMRGDRVKVPTMPRFKLVPHNFQSRILIPT